MVADVARVSYLKQFDKLVVNLPSGRVVANYSTSRHVPDVHDDSKVSKHGSCLVHRGTVEFDSIKVRVSGLID